MCGCALRPTNCGFSLGLVFARSRVETLAKSQQLWSVRVVLHGEDRVEWWADLDGRPIRAASGEQLPIEQALAQLEATLSAIDGADISLAIRTGTSRWLHVATRRWRMAVYLVLTHYERAFIASQSVLKDRADA